MTSNMSKSQKKIAEGDCSCSVDRISSLPENVIECIMNLMSVKDAARTCVLSSRWRYVWAHHPSVILDWRFLEEIIVIYIGTSYRKNYPNIVRQIVQNHVGYIRTFVLTIDLWLKSAQDWLPHSDIDMWVSSLCMRGLKELTLTNCGRNPYRVPCSVYSSSDLIKVNLDFCIIESGCFTNIQSLILGKVTFDSSVVLTTPLLTMLSLDNCRGILHFEISAPRLKSLRLCDNDDLYLKPFLTSTGIDYAFLHYRIENTYFEGCESVCLVKLLAAWPRISKLVVGGSLFKYLTAGRVPSKLGPLNLRSFSIHYMELDSEQMPWVLCILKNSPLLHKIEVWFDGNGLNEIPDIDESRSIVDLRMDRLNTVYMGEFLATPNELVFAKILLQCAPVLKRMLVEENDGVDSEQRVKILKKLLSLQHAFPKTRIVYWPYLDII